MDNFLINSSYLPLNEELSKYKNIYAIVDSNLFSHYSAFIQERFENVFTFESSEQNKSFKTVEKIISWLLERNAGRDSLLVGIGGGITTDICGFVASIYKRGIRFGLVPTTLTAQIDAAIGGKTGVNFNGIKNVAGTFSKAQFIYINPTFLKTLPERELLCGWGELLKTFIIGDKASFAEAAEILKNGTPVNESPELLTNAIRIKSEIVEKDRFESGIRAKLNLGHTFAHAIESCCQLFAPNENICNHGEAVAIGIKIATKFSYIKGLISQSEYQLIIDTISAAGYPTLGDVIKHCHNTSAEDFKKKLLHFMGNDKKCKEDFINFVFIIGVGEVKVIPTPLTEIEHYIDDLCND